MNLINFKKNPIYFILLALCALLPFQFALNPTSNIDLAIIRITIPILFLGWIFIALKNKQQLLPSNKFFALFVLYLFLALFSVFFAQNFFWSLRKLAFLFSIAPIFFIAASTLKTAQKQLPLTISIVCGASILAFLAITQFISQFIFGIDPVYNFLANHVSPIFLGRTFAKTVQNYPSWLVNAGGITYMRATAIFPDPHMLSYYLGMTIPWSIILYTKVKKYKWIFIISSFFLIIANVFTFTRGGYLALIISGIVILPLVSKNAALRIFTGIALFACLFSIVPSNPVGARLVSSFDAQEGSNIARLSNWQQAIKIITENPLGVGIGNYSLAVNQNASYREPIYAHNLYLDTAAELGLPAMLVMIALLFSVFYSFWKKAKTNSFYTAGVASIIVFSVHSLVENPFYSVHVFPLFLIIVAMASIKNSHEETINN